jgi:hypothetical protein
LSLVVMGKIIMQDPKCAKCSNTIKVYSYANSNGIKCPDCGAYYELISQNSNAQPGVDIGFTYEFLEFRCIHSSYLTPCENVCPTLGMYCKDHTSDKFIEEVQKEITSNDRRLQESKTKLDRVYESKKTWLIGKLSGIDETRKSSDSE